MKYLIYVILVFVFLFNSCAGMYNIVPVCRHYALLNAYTMGEKYQVRIIVGRVSDGGLHAKAQAKINGRWMWLTNDKTLVYTDNINPFIKVRKYYSLEKYSSDMQKIMYRGGKLWK